MILILLFMGVACCITWLLIVAICIQDVKYTREISAFCNRHHWQFDGHGSQKKEIYAIIKDEIVPCTVEDGIFKNGMCVGNLCSGCFENEHFVVDFFFAADYGVNVFSTREAARKALFEIKGDDL